MPLYQFTKAETGEITRHDLVLGDDIQTILDAGTYAVSRVEPETLSPAVTVTLAAAEEIEPPQEPEVPVEPLLPPRILLQGDGTVEVEIQDGTTILTISGTNIYDGEYALEAADFASGPVNLVAPALNGTPEVGETLFATPGLWVYDSANGAFSLSGQWQRDGVDVSGETAGTMEIRTGDQGGTLRFLETAADVAGSREAMSDAVSIAATATPPVGITYAMSGAPRADGFRIAIQTDAPVEGVSLDWSTSSDLSSDVTQTPALSTGNSARTARFELAGLPADTTVYYRARHNGQPTGDIRSAKTLPGAGQPFTFAFSSCGEAGPAPTWGHIASRNPDLFLSLGDTPYIDYNGTDPQVLRNAYSSFFASDHMQELLASTSFVYTWDDHDYASNNGNSSSPSKAASQEVYREIQPHFPLEADDAIHHAFTAGVTRFIVIDSRSYRVPGTTLLGAGQLAWVKAELSKAATDAAIKLVVFTTVVPWLTDGDNDTWFGFSAERLEIGDHILNVGLERRTLGIAGDMHALAYDDGMNNTFNTAGVASFPIAQAAPLNRNNSIKPGTYTQPPVSTSEYQFSTVTVAPQANGEVDVTTIAYSNNVEAYRHTFTTAPGQHVLEAPTTVTLSPATVPENAAAGYSVGTLSSDVAGATFALSDTSARFEISGTDVNVKSGATFTAGQTYTAGVIATNAAGSSSPQVLSITATAAVAPPAPGAFGKMRQTKQFGGLERNRLGFAEVTFDQAPLAGSLIVLIAAPDKATGPFTAPAGFSVADQHGGKARGEISGAIIYKVSDGTETGPLRVTWQTPQQQTLIAVEFEGPFAASPLLPVTASAAVKTEAAGVSVSLASGAAVTVPSLALATYMVDSINKMGVSSATGGFTVQPSIGTAGNPGANDGNGGVITATKLLSSPETPSTTIGHDGTADGSIGFLNVFAGAEA